MDYDLKIVGGDVVDGSGAPARRADLGIRDGAVVALGDAPGSARETLEAAGRVVAPGFLDIHTHYDAQVLWDPLLSISPWHGVTSVVMGNCGFGVAPVRPADRGVIVRTLEKVEGMSRDALEAGMGEKWPFGSFPEYLAWLGRRGLGANAAVYVGHTPVRLFVMGEAASERAAREDEVAAMRRLVEEALAAGAIGFATSKGPTHVGYGGRPVPSRLAEPDELAALFGALGASGRGLAQVSIGPGLYVGEIADLARASGRPVTWAALLAGLEIEGEGPDAVLARIAALRAEGVDVVPQVSCRALSFDYDFREPFPFEGLPAFARAAAAEPAEKRVIYAEPAFRRAFRDQLASPDFLGVLDGCFERTVVSLSPRAPELEERGVAELARERGVDPVDFALDLALDSELRARFRFDILNHDEDAVAELLRAPGTVLGLADSGAHANQLCDACFSTHLLGRFVRERADLPLERAVWMLTARVADLLGLPDRGRLLEGAPADVVVFDPSTVGPGPVRRVRDLPAGADRLVADAHGIDAVLVNGVVVRRDGRDALDPDGPLPGAVLRPEAP